MSALTLGFTFPAYVRRDGRHWTARPLLAGGTAGAVGSDPAVAVDALEAGVRKRYEHLRPGEEPDLLRLSFDPPDLAVTRVATTLAHGKRAAERLLLVGTFVLGEQRYATVPRLDRTFVLPHVRDWTVPLQQAVDALLRERRAAGDDPEPPDEAELRRDRVLPARVRIHADLEALALGGGRAIDAWLARLDERFRLRSAARELAALAVDLGERRDLHRTLVADPRAQLVVEAIEAPRPTPLALVGPSGSGRTTLVHEAVHRLREAALAEARRALLDALHRRTNVADAPSPRRIYHLDPQRIVTGMSVVGEWQRRLQLVLEWLRDRRPTTLGQQGGDALYVDDPVALARVGRAKGSEMVASTVIRGWLEDGAFPMIVEATPEQWHRLTELDRPFAELFRVVRVDAPSSSAARAVLVRHRARLEASSDVRFEAAALDRLGELDLRYGGTRGAPGGLVDRLVQVAAAAVGTATAATVDEVFRTATGLRPEIADPHRALDDGQLRQRLGAELVGQPAAIDALAGAVHALKSGLRPRGRPVACLLFVGPTGVGKTEAAKVLTRTLFSSPLHLVRFDMNAFADPGAVHRLIGDRESGEGLLTGAVRRRPFCVLLLDEIEKAHPLVHDLLLQVLDEGRLTDAGGRTTSFAEAVVVLTSNVGATESARGVGFDRDARTQEGTYRGAVAKAFRPELVNRLDRIVVFADLGRAELRRVADVQLSRLLSRDGFRDRVVLLDLDDADLDRVAADAWDPRYGARGLKRAMERRIVAAAAAELAAAEPGQPVRVLPRWDGDHLGFAVTPLRWASVAAPAAPVHGSLHARIDRLEQRLEPLRPTDALVARSPRSAEDADHAEVLAVLDALRRLRSAVSREASRIPRGASQAARRAIPAAPSRRKWDAPARVLLEPQRVAAGLRAFLLDAADHEPERPAGEIDVALAELRVDALTAGMRREATYVLRPAARSAPSFAAAADWLVEGWARLAERLEGELRRERETREVPAASSSDSERREQSQGRRRERDRRRLRGGGAGPATPAEGAEEDDGGRRDRQVEFLHAEGAGLCALLDLEVGLHWWLPAADAPSVVELAQGEARCDTILRTICPPSSSHDAGAVHDARSGQVVPHDRYADALPRWLLVARG